MRSFKKAQPTPADNGDDGQSGGFFGDDQDRSSRDVMCLVYPDGSTTTVPPQSGDA